MPKKRVQNCASRFPGAGSRGARTTRWFVVSATSTGTPEINDYPFTTIRLKMGHVIGRAARYQVREGRA